MTTFQYIVESLIYFGMIVSGTCSLSWALQAMIESKSDSWTGVASGILVLVLGVVFTLKSYIAWIIK